MEKMYFCFAPSSCFPHHRLNRSSRAFLHSEQRRMCSWRRWRNKSPLLLLHVIRRGCVFHLPTSSSQTYEGRAEFTLSFVRSLSTRKDTRTRLGMCVHIHRVWLVNSYMNANERLQPVLCFALLDLTFARLSSPFQSRSHFCPEFWQASSNTFWTEGGIIIRR